MIFFLFNFFVKKAHGGREGGRRRQKIRRQSEEEEEEEEEEGKDKGNQVSTQLFNDKSITWQSCSTNSHLGRIVIGEGSLISFCRRNIMAGRGSGGGRGKEMIFRLFSS